MSHHLGQIEKAHPLKKGTSSDVQRIHLSGNPATQDHRADAFASHSLERFTFSTTIPISAKHLQKFSLITLTRLIIDPFSIDKGLNYLNSILSL